MRALLVAIALLPASILASACISKGDTILGGSGSASEVDDSTDSSGQDDTDESVESRDTVASEESEPTPSDGSTAQSTSVPPAETSTTESSENISIEHLAAGTDYTCGIQADTTLSCWGDEFSFGEVPTGDGFAQVAVGTATACAVKSDGSIVCWGKFTLGQTETPEGNFQSVAVGMDAACALRADGTALCWGSAIDNESREPSGPFESIDFLCGVTVTGEASCWGNNPYGDHPSDSEFVQVTVGTVNACGLTLEGWVVCWGTDIGGVTEVPEGTFEQIDLGGFFGCGIRTADKFVECWPSSSAPFPPPFAFKSITCGLEHCCGIRMGGEVRCWGESSYGATTPP